LNAYPTCAAADWKPAAVAITSGSLNIEKPSAESASCQYVERRLVNAYGLPPTLPVHSTSP
jgi:hypothetical protein